MIKLIQGDCLEKMKDIPDGNIDLIITSPPYNMTKRKGGFGDKKYRYDIYKDDKDYDTYIKWSLEVFNLFDKVLIEQGTVLYNFSYSVENPVFPYLLVSEIEKNTSFTIGDTLIWKKKNSIPYPASPNRLQRIWEFFFVFVRKVEVKIFKTNKKVGRVSPTGQKYYNPVQNFIEAKNNDGKNELNEATFSTELISKILWIYANKDSVVLDPFSGTGTTMVACKNYGCTGIGIELSQAQIDIAEKRIASINAIQNEIDWKE